MFRALTAAAILSLSIVSCTSDSASTPLDEADSGSGGASGSSGTAEGAGSSSTGSSSTGSSNTVDPGKASSVALPKLDRLVPNGKPGDSIGRAREQRSPSGLTSSVLQTGSGPAPTLGSQVDLHVTCWLRRGGVLGKEFWNSRDDGKPHSYRLNSDDLVEGMVEAIQTMRRGERRWLVIPSRLAYGKRGYGNDVPSGRDIVVDVELVSFTVN
ncbi:MAG: FKBP-type peptidyl-prolyl cis-trans isomerase [Planctomycetota bacterium]